MLFRDYLENLMRQQPKFGRASAVYAFTTENLAGHFHLLGIENNSVLTICGSGDHVLNAVLCGAREITAFDINPLSLLWTELKLAAVSSLCLDEFKLFFLRESLTGEGLNGSALNYDVYSRVRASLADESADFFDKLYLAFDKDGSALRNSAFFNTRYDFNALKLGGNEYLSSEADYQRVRKWAGSVKIRYRCASVLDIAHKERGRVYDTIILSNVCDYAPNLFNPQADPYESFVHGLCRDMLNVLAPDGVICALYIYGQPDSDLTPPHSDLDNPSRREAILKASGFEYQEIAFCGVRPGMEDSVVLLKRRQYELPAE